MTNYHTLTITDCAEEAGQITRKDTADPKGTCIVEIDAGCRFNMFGGEITGLDSSENSAPYPTAVSNRVPSTSAAARSPAISPMPCIMRTPR